MREAVMSPDDSLESRDDTDDQSAYRDDEVSRKRTWDEAVGMDQGDEKASQDFRHRPWKISDHQPSEQSEGSQTSTSTQYVCLILHRVKCKNQKTQFEDHSRHPETACYLDAPRMFEKDSRGDQLRGKQHIPDVNFFLEDHENVVMVVYRDYHCRDYHNTYRNRFEKRIPAHTHQSVILQHRPLFYTLSADLPPAEWHKESLQIISPELNFALDDLVASDPTTFGPWDEPKNLVAPYNYFFHHMQTFSNVANDKLTLLHKKLFSVLSEYIEQAFGSEYEAAEQLFETGIVSQQFFPKLFRAKEIVVSGTMPMCQAYVVENITALNSNAITLSCYSWKFDGRFRREEADVKVDWPLHTTEVLITQLATYPLRLAPPELREALLARGKMFWSCRNRKLVTYMPPERSNFELHTTNPRFMIDFETYRYLHRDYNEDYSDEAQALGDVDVTLEAPPAESFLTLLPPKILGFGFHNKKWKDLPVDYIREVPWNKKAFEKLVLEDHKKELIQAVVTETLEKNNAADLVDDKGNGLILLLHGPPGTGKTLTAETIAELSEKPLYRVTCGDLGTEPQDVETYLESALHIGTVWGCVVLLDEADVFLEERTQTDLKRNALVSVFLRVLEYYEGILILTSNRVLTFDEAFKSRVQLTIQYPLLGDSGREKIWINFFDALHDAKVDLDLDQIIRKVPLLAQHKLNGRQIRNTLKTARQLAKFSKKALSYDHLQRVIDVGKEFESYCHQRMGHTDEQYAQESRIR